jgi:hypothetical protein
LKFFVLLGLASGALSVGLGRFGRFGRLDRLRSLDRFCSLDGFCGLDRFRRLRRVSRGGLYKLGRLRGVFRLGLGFCRLEYLQRRVIVVAQLGEVVMSRASVRNVRIVNSSPTRRGCVVKARIGTARRWS